MSRRKQREMFRYFVEVGLLEVTEAHKDPLKAMYRMPDPEGVKRALIELGAW